ncbi:MAG: DUF4097 family beta strand repeat-containing protein [bacterium]
MKYLFHVIALSLLVSISYGDETRTFEKRFTPTSSQTVEIMGFHGADVKFMSWEKNEVFISLIVEYDASDRDEEKKFLDGIKIVDSQTSTTLRITYKEPSSSRKEGFFGIIKRIFSGSYRSKRISGEIYVPKTNALTSDLQYGSITLEGMKNTIRLTGQGNTLKIRRCDALSEIDNNYGSTTIEQCGGTLNLSAQSSSKILIENFAGGGRIDANYSNVTVRKFTKALSIQVQSGTIKAEDIEGDLTLDADYSTVTAERIKGVVDVQDQSGKVTVKEVTGLIGDVSYSNVSVTTINAKNSRGVDLKGQSGSITLQDIAGKVRIESPYTTIRLQKIKGDIDISDQSGTITGDGIAGDWTSDTPYSSLTLQQMESKKITITNTSGGVNLQLAALPLQMQIKTEYTSVSVTMPKGYSGEVNLEATYGEVDCNLPIRIKNLGGGSYGIGKIGNGSGSITIETKSGNIKLNEK